MIEIRPFDPDKDMEMLLVGASNFLGAFDVGVFDPEYLRGCLPVLAEDGYIRIAYLGGKFAGYLVGTLSHRWTDGLPLAAELALWVESSARSVGVASMLIDDFLDWGREKGVTLVTFSTLTPPTGSQGLYERKGMKIAEWGWVCKL
jgi:GNAT superfamily N-acetyltransferase